MPLSLLGRRWRSHTELSEYRDKLLPSALPTLLDEILAGQLTHPATLHHRVHRVAVCWKPAAQ